MKGARYAFGTDMIFALTLVVAAMLLATMICFHFA